MSATIRRSLLHALVLVLTVLGALLASLSLSSPAEAMSAQARNHVVHVAASKAGTPYRYGATGPRAFDCSGYTKWVFSKIGRHLPRTSSAQAGAVRHVSRANRHRGDLVFFRSGGHVYHVGIYAGHNSVWHAPRPGQRVHREHIWTRSVSYGRVR
jgi:cell wall-associated NlpC family hydrolase